MGGWGKAGYTLEKKIIVGKVTKYVKNILIKNFLAKTYEHRQKGELK